MVLLELVVGLAVHLDLHVHEQRVLIGQISHSGYVSIQAISNARTKQTTSIYDTIYEQRIHTSW